MKNCGMAGIAAMAIGVPCIAHAQGSVTLYGIIDTGIEYASVSGKSTTRLESSPVYPTRWGLTGREELGGGTALIFKLENGFNVDNGTSLQNGALFGREAWVGIKNNLGQIQFGVNYTPFHTTLVTYSLGGIDTLAWGNAANNFVLPVTLRTNNSVRYVSPAMAGFTLRASYALGSNGATNLPRTFGNTMAVGVSYSLKSFSADVDFMTQVYSTATTPTAASQTQTGNYALFAAKYDFGVVQAAVLFETHRGGSALGSATNYANVNNNLYEVSLVVPIKLSGLMFSFGQYKNLSNSAGNATSYGVRYDYPLSKRTAVYAGVAAVVNGSAASFTVNDSAGAGVSVGTPGHNVVAGLIGMSHKF